MTDPLTAGIFVLSLSASTFIPPYRDAETFRLMPDGRYALSLMDMGFVDGDLPPLPALPRDEKLAALRAHFFVENEEEVLQYLDQDNDDLMLFLLDAPEMVSSVLKESFPLSLEHFQDPDEPDFERLFLTVHSGNPDGRAVARAHMRLAKEWLHADGKPFVGRLSVDIV